MKLLFSLMLVLSFGISSNKSCAQQWMPGYNYRKKITINKSRVTATEVISGSTVLKQDLTGFPVLIEIQDNSLIHIPGSCNNKITDLTGRDISFALTGSPAQPLDFQLEHYDPVQGKLSCWVRLSTVSANGTSSPATALFFYYGSSFLHDPIGFNTRNVWSDGFKNVWHLNKDMLPAISLDARSGIPLYSVPGGGGTVDEVFTASKIAGGLKLDRAAGRSFSSPGDTSSNVTVSAWARISYIGSDQVIVANDTIDGSLRNGYALKITAAGKVVMELYRSMTVYTATTSAQVELNKWTHVAGIVSGNQLSVFINGLKAAGTSNVKPGRGSSIRIGSSKQGTQYFHGHLDEIRIQNTSKSVEWLKTQFVNQDNTGLFYSMGEEEYNPAVFVTYTGALGGSWDTNTNWSNGTIPSAGSNVIIPPGKTVRTKEGSSSAAASLLLQSGSELSLGGSLTVGCSVRIDIGATIKLNSCRLISRGHIINNGGIYSDQQRGTLECSGNAPVQEISGSGIISIHQLENNQVLPENKLVLNSALEISGYAKLSSGVLCSNGNLTLLADGSNAATVLPVLQNTASITGNVNVQHYISGSYSPPASARNWRLLASPVFTDSTSAINRYGISAFQNSMFITGPGGEANGFDPSPLNNGTIYVHDESLSGTMTQKYQTIANSSAKIDVGKGLYVFSRGPRTVPDAYNRQIAKSPFMNPEGYCITHTGKIFTGDLTLRLGNRNSAGDGFNLLGNPYPAPLSWGKLIKSGLSPYIWQYDPINGDYMVSDSAGTLIPSGTGFFAKVNAGQASGVITFTENAKKIPAEISSDQIMASGTSVSAAKQELCLTVTLTRKSFRQQYRLYLTEHGNDGHDDQDALKIGEGYLNIASVVNNARLVIENRSANEKKQQVKLFVRGWEDGAYSMNIKASASLYKAKTILLTDSLLNKDIVLEGTEKNYVFDMGTKSQAVTAANRFVITLTTLDQAAGPVKKTEEITFYPNPVTEMLNLKLPQGYGKNVMLLISDTFGRTASRILLENHSGICTIDCSNLPKGLYAVKILGENTVAIKNFKFIKE